MTKVERTQRTPTSAFWAGPRRVSTWEKTVVVGWTSKLKQNWQPNLFNRVPQLEVGILKRKRQRRNTYLCPEKAWHAGRVPKGGPNWQLSLLQARVERLPSWKPWRKTREPSQANCLARSATPNGSRAGWGTKPKPEL